MILQHYLGYPNVSSKSDTFNVWLAQNSGMINVQMAQEQANYQINQTANIMNAGMNVLGAGASASGLNGEQTVGGKDVLNAVQSDLDIAKNIVQTNVNHEYYIKTMMAQVEQHKMLPDNVTMGGSNATLLGYGYMDKNVFTRYTIKSQFARRIDKYFDMYGYLTNELKQPNLKNRPNWN